MDSDDQDRGRGGTTATPVTGTNSQPEAAQRKGVPDAPADARPEKDQQKTGGQAFSGGGCI